MGIHCIKCSLKPIAAFYHFNCVSSHTARTEDEFLLKVHTNEFNGGTAAYKLWFMSHQELHNIPTQILQVMQFC